MNNQIRPKCLKEKATYFLFYTIIGLHKVDWVSLG